jgi:hypothetical protein
VKKRSRSRSGSSILDVGEQDFVWDSVPRFTEESVQKSQEFQKLENQVIGDILGFPGVRMETRLDPLALLFVSSSGEFKS